jgi:hypothetical protein
VLSVFEVLKVRSMLTLSFEQRSRADALWANALRILREEAEYAMTLPHLPLWPLNSIQSGDVKDGDSKAEEDAGVAALLAWAKVFLRDLPEAELWGRKARQLAYDAITTKDDPADFDGIKTITVWPDGTLINHGEESRYYANATLFLLQLGALPFRLTEWITHEDVPDEFHHNVDLLRAKCQSYIVVDAAGELVWNTTELIDPASPVDWPLAMMDDPATELKFTTQKVRDDCLWKCGPVAPGPIAGSPAWERAVKDAKMVCYYALGSKEWHFGPKYLNPYIVSPSP